MVHIRPFEEGDTPRLLAIEKLCPHGNEQCAVGVDKKSSITARYALYDNWNVLVAEEDAENEEKAGAGEVGGWIGWTVKQSPTQKEPYVYLAEVMVHPDFRRKGVATTLMNDAEQHAQETGSNHLYCYIYDPNDASKALFEKQGYSNMRTLKSCALTAYKKAAIKEDYTIERVTTRDIPAVVRLINEYYAGYTHFAPYTPEGFVSYLTGIPGYGLEQFWVAHDKEAEGNVVACTGLWDWSVLAEMCYTHEPRLWKVMRTLYGFLSLFGRMPRIPAEGEYFRVYFMTDYAFAPDRAAAMSALIKALNNVVLDANRDFFVANLDPDDPLVGVLKKFKPQINTWHIYAKAIEREGESELPAFSPFYVDIRDCIL